MTKEKNHAKEQALTQFSYIKDMFDRLNKEENENKQDEINEEIQENALEVTKVQMYSILLCTGGPAVRIFGRLREHSEPETAKLQCQDWGTPWEDVESADEDVLLEYAQLHYFGE